MGGSGGGGFLGNTNPAALAQQLREAEGRTRNELFEAEASDLVAEKLADFNDRDVEGTRRILDNVRAELADELEAEVDLLFGGSVAKRTYVDGLSDVDALVLLTPGAATSDTPDELRSIFAERLRARFGRDTVREGHMAVTLILDGKEVQLLPAKRAGERFLISNAAGTGWATINPRAFAESLVRANSAMSGKLVPVIKLAKAVISGLPEQRRLSGYHIECMAVEAFKGYQGTQTPKAMLQHFFNSAPARVQTPIQDSTGQCSYVDEYLGEAGSLKRKIVADALDRVARRIRNADGAKSVDQWRQLLEGS
jgi:hypothetical protein